MRKSSNFKTLQLILLPVSLILTILASFMPFFIELMYGLSAVCLTGYAACLFR